MVLRPANRPGFATPTAILIAAILTVTLAGAFLLIGVERRTNDNQRAQVSSYTLAASGLERFVVNRSEMGFTSTPPAVYESTRVTLSRGYADVVLQRIRPAVGTIDPIYVIRSRGAETVARMSGTPTAERTVAQLAVWQRGRMNALSAWTSLSGLRKNGGSGVLSGIDGCASGTNVAGVAVPTTPGYTQNGGSSVPTGSPPIKDLGTPAQAAEAVKIDWDKIVNENAIQPSITIPGGTWPSFADTSYWPVIRVNGDFSLPSSGRGLLIVTGSLTISDALVWDGVVLVGSTATSNGNNTLNGAMVTGLNVKLGATVPESDIGNGTKTFRYNSCNVSRALTGLSKLVPLTNAWADNWATY